MRAKTKEVINNLVEYIEHNDFKGYDPYDALNTYIPFNILGKIPAYIFMQMQVRNPINIRKLIGIKKERGVKSMALILESYISLYKLTEDKKYLIKAQHIFDWIVHKKLKGYSGYCWSIHFPIAWTDNNRPKSDPSSVLACFVFNAIFEFYLITKDENAKNVLIGIIEFIEIHVPKTVNENGICYSYTTRKRDIVFNANMLIAEAFAKAYFLTGNIEYKTIANQCVKFNINYQKEDGKWNYKYLEKTNTEKGQIDFHQGFMILSLSEYIKYSSDDNHVVLASLEKGLAFYKNVQFKFNGTSYYRYPVYWPIDIHNQAVGILALSKLSSRGKDNLEFANRIAEWTINNMYCRSKGYFFFRKHKFFMNKISYMRWSQSWMLLALTTLELVNSKNKYL